MSSLAQASFYLAVLGVSFIHALMSDEPVTSRSVSNDHCSDPMVYLRLLFLAIVVCNFLSAYIARLRPRQVAVGTMWCLRGMVATLMFRLAVFGLIAQPIKVWLLERN